MTTIYNHYLHNLIFRSLNNVLLTLMTFLQLQAKLARVQNELQAVSVEYEELQRGVTGNKQVQRR